MKKLLFLICLTVLFTHSLSSQEQSIGVQIGVLNPNFFTSNSLQNNSILFYGVKYEYTPKVAFFSLSAALLNVNNLFLTPISVNLKLGKKLKFIASGGMMPVYRFWNLGFQKKVELGATWHVGLEYKISKSFSINGSFGNYYIPIRKISYTDFIGGEIYKVIEKSQFFSLGLNYKFK